MPIRVIVLVAPLPVGCLLIYAGLRLFQIQPPMETGVSEFLSTTAFAFGAAFSYFAAAVFAAGANIRKYWQWMAASGLLFLLAIDESFMIHEHVGHWLFTLMAGWGPTSVDWTEAVPFAAYGVALVGILVMFRDAKMPFWVLVALFFLFCGIAQAADTFGGGEGIVTIAGRDIDYEQIFEVVGGIFLASAFGYHAAISLAPAVLAAEGPDQRARVQ